MTGTIKSDPEIIEVRTDERFDPGPLEAWLREHLPGTDGAMSIAQFGGGHANLTYMIAFADGADYVVRRPPLGPVAPSAHDMEREHRVLAPLSKVFDKAPISYVFCADESVLGAPFHVMERRHGFVIRKEIPERFTGDPALNRRIGEMLVDTLADLHLVDANAAGLGDLGHPEGFVQRQLEGWTKRWHAAKDTDNAEIDAQIAWLAKGLPTSGRVTLLHNDFKLDNVLVDNGDPGICVAVLDWDMCTRGDPLLDLGYLLNFWAQAGDPDGWASVTGMPSDQPGFLTRAQAIERYAARTGFDLGDVRWYHVFGVFKLAVIIQQIYIRYLRGQTKDERFAVFGERVRGLAEKGVVLMEAGAAKTAAR
ncbi:MAG TPA: phosphotransferase family protein [Alphaproteobacteria bacterium]|nr:phosphotransferase family protein [Alphaproteobacteria bacterium]